MENQMENQMEIQYVVYVLQDNGQIFDMCGEFNTLSEAEDYINNYLKIEDAKRLINDDYAIYLRTEVKIK